MFLRQAARFFTFTTTDPEPAADVEASVHIRCKAGVLLRNALPRRHRNTEADASVWSAIPLRPVQTATEIRNCRWLVVRLNAGNDSATAALQKYIVAGEFQLFGVGRIGMSIVALVQKERQQWSFSQAETPIDTYTLTIPARAGREKSLQCVYDALAAFLQAARYAIVNFDLPAEGDASGAELDKLFLEIVQDWATLSEDQVDQEIGVAQGKEKDERSARQKLIVKSTAALRRVATRHRSIMLQMIVPFTSQDIPYLQDLAHLDVLTCTSFDPDSGRELRMSLRQYIEEGEWGFRALVLLGRAGAGKTPAAMSICRTVTDAWGQTASPGHIIVAATMDSLKYAQSAMIPGTGIILDDWAPATAKNGRGLKVAADELKALLTVNPGRQIYTRWGDTQLPSGPRLVTSNCGSLSSWCAFLRDDWQELSEAQRRDKSCVSADCQAVMKRCMFCFVDDSLISRSTRDSHTAPIRESHAKRAKLSMDKWSRPSGAPGSSMDM